MGMDNSKIALLIDPLVKSCSVPDTDSLMSFQSCFSFDLLFFESKN
jgi:hypothetical protein